ncbi:hypothetical protein HIM_04033 [Hirsutella minnesotensis 3608]|uniref:EF-hand domain-containing protein n=1 Tax=Hirsutella minnesotensis 3608 TaxID=1043627 RepID=A0A0F8A242_9HYPO|nr:hypothetical protein HIM_04033 [Hirsutella minnesotensis 3608]
MAYNRPYNPDALPRFAEPDNKNGPVSPPNSAHTPSRYESKPPPPVPQQQQHHPQHGGSLGGGRPPPQQQQQNYNSRLPPSPVPDVTPGSESTLRTGQLSERELSAALVNGDWTAFDIQTVRMMIRMFDSDRNGTINFDEFCGLWSFLASWRTLFDRFDADRSGNISLREFSDALVAFRYRLSPHFVELLFRTYDKRNEGVMSFDLFVQSCISLKRMTDVFKKYDNDRDGFITLSFEDFLSEILKQLK